MHDTSSGRELWEIAVLKYQETTPGCHDSHWRSIESQHVCDTVLSAVIQSSDCGHLQADARTPGAATPKWELSADAECAAWSIAQPTQFLVASEDGVVACFDARAGPGSAPIFRLAAHDKPTCAISFCAAAPNLLATASADKLVRLNLC